MKLRNILFLIGAASLGLFSCSTEIPVTPVAGETSLTLLLSMADLKTKADSPIATEAELQINNCHVAIFDATTGDRIFNKNFAAGTMPTLTGSTYSFDLGDVRTFGKAGKQVTIFVIANADDEAFVGLESYSAYERYVVTTGSFEDSKLVKVGKETVTLQYGGPLASVSISLIQLTARVDFGGITMNGKSVTVGSVKVNGIRTKSGITIFSDSKVENAAESTTTTTTTLTLPANRFYTYEGASLTLEINATVDGKPITIPIVDLSDKPFIKGNR